MRSPYLTLQRSIPSWRVLRALGSNAAVRSANVWAVAVPVAARVLAGMSEVVTFTLRDSQITLHLALPFSWKVLFVGAMAFLLANVVYALYCPRLIKETANYREFSDQRQSGLELLYALHQVKRANLGAGDEIQRFMDWISARHQLLLTHQSQQGSQFAANEEGVFAEAYSVAVEAIGRVALLARLLCSLLYAFGMLALATVIGQNAMYVLSHW